MGMDLPRIDSSNLWDKTYTLLKDRIVRRDFKPNQKLSIADLAAQLGVSRTPVRDALNRLETEGLIKTVPRVGTFVNAIELDGLVDSIDMRLMLEWWVVEKLPTLPLAHTTQAVQRLEHILDRATATLKRFSVESYLRTDYNLQFHVEFIKTAGNKKQLEIYLSMMNYHFLAAERALFTKDMVKSALRQHYAIVNNMKRALKLGDFAELKASIKLHLDDSKERLIKRLQANGGQI
jgi:DNA-binding GntR family transcriptional regulator